MVYLLVLLSLGLGFTLNGCDKAATRPFAINEALTSCAPGTASILVGDGFLQILCGCTLPSETSGTTVSASGNLTCHLSTSDTKLFFYYLGTTQRHQIIPTVPGSFLPSPISDPSRDPVIRVYVVQFTTPATVYGFEDAFTRVSGQVFVP